MIAVNISTILFFLFLFIFVVLFFFSLKIPQFLFSNNLIYKQIFIYQVEQIIFDT